MELFKGGELFSKVAKGRLKEDVTRAYFQQLISAVDFCHSRGVYHRDLKPKNLLLDDDGNLMVTDFGLSAFSENLKQDRLLHTTCGTPVYVAPEVIGKNGYDGAKDDLWSCGVILYVIIAGFKIVHEIYGGINRTWRILEFQCKSRTEEEEEGDGDGGSDGAMSLKSGGSNGFSEGAPEVSLAARNILSCTFVFVGVQEYGVPHILGIFGKGQATPPTEGMGKTRTIEVHSALEPGVHEVPTVKAFEDSQGQSNAASILFALSNLPKPQETAEGAKALQMTRGSRKELRV
ncbi:hypothetical protein NE237_015954 [Protea cynaroides]|uniref:Protein kinase domain-containing protein n=1 Tax=Protea cynaroides TaxID=273540 RepID=A0A9Q0QRK6_9MAGN|nr:hypothetical protein NE237_015954 [Protea cynaroides]